MGFCGVCGLRRKYKDNQHVGGPLLQALRCHNFQAQHLHNERPTLHFIHLSSVRWLPHVTASKCCLRALASTCSRAASKCMYLNSCKTHRLPRWKACKCQCRFNSPPTKGRTVALLVSHLTRCHMPLGPSQVLSGMQTKQALVPEVSIVTMLRSASNMLPSSKSKTHA